MLPKIRLPLLAAVFFLSGSAALIYQVCWQRLLTIYYGIGPVSTAIVVSVFMLGLGMGALAGGAIAKRSTNLVVVYICIEAIIGLFGLMSLRFLSVLGHATAGSDYAVTGICVSAFLLLPTTLMGMTLPIAIAIQQRWFESLLINVSFYYFINTVGAAFGAVLCSYVLISFFGIDGAVWTAVAINAGLSIAVIAFWQRTGKAKTVAELPATSGRPVHSTSLLALLFVNGFIAIGYQMIWYRIVGVFLKDSAYSFSTILAVYLLGIGLGSLWLQSRAEKNRRFGANMEVYLLLNVAIAVMAGLSVLVVYWALPYPPLKNILHYVHSFFILPNAATKSSAILTLLATFFWPTILVLPSAFFMGASFPTGLTLLSRREGEANSGVSIGYFTTILGNCSGALGTSFVLLPAFGTVWVLLGFVAIQVAYLAGSNHSLGKLPASVLKVGALVLFALVVISAPSSKELYRRFLQEMPGYDAYYKEGVEGVTMVYRKEEQNHDAKMRIFINGQGHGVRPGYRTTYEAVQALSYAPNSKKVLVIGYGIGVTVDAFLRDDQVQSILVLEVNRTAFQDLMRIDEIRSSMTDPRVSVIFDDGRRYLERSKERFDVISMDSIRPWSAYSNNLYSVDFFQMLKDHLTPGGVASVWDVDDTGILAKSMATVFDHVDRYETTLVGTLNAPIVIAENFDLIVNKLPKSFIQEVEQLRGPVVCNRRQILAATASIRPNRDLNPQLEYYLGRDVKNRLTNRNPVWPRTICQGLIPLDHGSRAPTGHALSG